MPPTDFARLDAAVARFRKGSPNIALAFDEVRRLIGEPAAPPAPVPSKLLWAPPTLGMNALVVQPNSVLSLDDSRDYAINGAIAFGKRRGVTIIGGRNIVWIGGEIVNETPIQPGQPIDDAYGLYLKNQIGVVHLEGLWIHGRGIGQALVLDQGKGATVQVQHCRFEALHPVHKDLVHTDGIQSWRGPKNLRLGYTTIRTTGTGIQTQPHQYGVQQLDLWERRFVNVEQVPEPANEHTPYALWKGAHSGGWWREVNEQFWVKNLGHLAHPDVSSWGSFGIGRPSSGDFCPAGVAGIAYRRGT